MEYFGMFVSYVATSFVTTRLIMRNEDVINLGRTFAQAGIIAVGIFAFTILLNMLRAYHVCEAKDGKNRSLGISSGISLSIFACILALCIFIWSNMTQVVVSIITAILPILTDYIEVFRGVLVALAGIIGYWIGRIFIGLC